VVGCVVSPSEKTGRRGGVSGVRLGAVQCLGAVVCVVGTVAWLAGAFAGCGWSAPWARSGLAAAVTGCGAETWLCPPPEPAPRSACGAVCGVTAAEPGRAAHHRCCRRHPGRRAAPWCASSGVPGRGRGGRVTGCLLLGRRAGVRGRRVVRRAGARSGGALFGASARLGACASACACAGLGASAGLGACVRLGASAGLGACAGLVPVPVGCRCPAGCASGPGCYRRPGWWHRASSDRRRSGPWVLAVEFWPVPCRGRARPCRPADRP